MTDHMKPMISEINLRISEEITLPNMAVSKSLTKALENSTVAILWNKINEIIPNFPDPTRIEYINSCERHFFVWKFSDHFLRISIDEEDIMWRYIDSTKVITGFSFDDLVHYLNIIVIASVNES